MMINLDNAKNIVQMQFEAEDTLKHSRFNGYKVGETLTRKQIKMVAELAQKYSVSFDEAESAIINAAIRQESLTFPHRRDVTKNTAATFAELQRKLQAQGFDVDHFHAVALWHDDQGWPHEEIFHISVDDDGEFFCDHGDIKDSPQGWRSLVADEWH